MRGRPDDSEKTIAIAFLRSGHPWLAFGTVMVKSGIRLLLAIAIIAGGVAIERSDGISTLLKHIPTAF